MQRGVVWCSTLFLSVLIVPGLASGLPALREMDGFLDLSISESMDCDGPGHCFAVDVAVDASMNPIEVLLFDLQVDWDPSFLELDAINFSGLLATSGVVEMDTDLGLIDDLFGDVLADPPIPVGDVLFELVFEVIPGNALPKRVVLEIGDLSGSDAFFERPVLVADGSFDPLSPTPNALIISPEPSTGLLVAGGLTVLALRRRECTR